MFNRTLIMISVSLMVIIVFFNFITLYIAFDQGVFTNSAGQTQIQFNMAIFVYIFFIVVALIGAILTGLAYKNQSMSQLFLGTLFFIICSIPSVVYNLNNAGSQDPFLLAKFAAPSSLLNILQIFLAKKGVTDYKSGLSGIRKKK